MGDTSKTRKKKHGISTIEDCPPSKKKKKQARKKRVMLPPLEVVERAFPRATEPTKGRFLGGERNSPRQDLELYGKELVSLFNMEVAKARRMQNQ